MGVQVRSEAPRRMIERRVKCMLTRKALKPNKLIECQGASIAIQLQTLRRFEEVLLRL
jgi:hypothetical protein